MFDLHALEQADTELRTLTCDAQICEGATPLRVVVPAAGRDMPPRPAGPATPPAQCPYAEAAQ